jgi:hypothetical protein
MHSPEVKEFIRQHSALFWYIPEDKKEYISEDLLVETILNYGSLEDSLTLISLLGKSNVQRILTAAKGRKKGNYFPEIHNFFSLLLARHA